MPEKRIKNALYKSQLFAVILVNVALFWVAFNSGDIVAGAWDGVVRSWQKSAILPAIGGLVTIALMRFFDEQAKARMVFLRWHDPMPGCRAFSHYAHSDQRIDVNRLRAIVGQFPTSATEQNARWYSLYRPMRAEPEIIDALSDYLIMRDWASVTFILFVLLMPTALVAFPSTYPALGLGFVLALQYLFASTSSANAGVRLVCNVMAARCAQP